MSPISGAAALVTANRLPTDGQVPIPRSSAVCCTVPDGTGMLMFGGVGLREAYNDVNFYAFGGNRWRALSCTGSAPAPRGGACGTFLPNIGFVVFGGRHEAFYNDVAVLDVARLHWVTTSHAVAPVPREDAACCAAGDSDLFVYGGTDSDNSILNDGWLWDGNRSSWAEVPMAGDMPDGGTTGMTLTRISPTVNTAVAVGGCDGDTYNSDAFLLDLDNFMWRRVLCRLHLPRQPQHLSHGLGSKGADGGDFPLCRTHSVVAALDCAKDRSTGVVTVTVVAAGGYRGAQALNDVFVATIQVEPRGEADESKKDQTVSRGFVAAEEAGRVFGLVEPIPSATIGARGAACGSILPPTTLSANNSQRGKNTPEKSKGGAAQSVEATPAESKYNRNGRLMVFGGCNAVEFLDDSVVVAVPLCARLHTDEVVGASDINNIMAGLVVAPHSRKHVGGGVRGEGVGMVGGSGALPPLTPTRDNVAGFSSNSAMSDSGSKSAAISMGSGAIEPRGYAGKSRSSSLTSAASAVRNRKPARELEKAMTALREEVKALTAVRPSLATLSRNNALLDGERGHYSWLGQQGEWEAEAAGHSSEADEDDAGALDPKLLDDVSQLRRNNDKLRKQNKKLKGTVGNLTGQLDLIHQELAKVRAEVVDLKRDHGHRRAATESELPTPTQSY